MLLKIAYPIVWVLNLFANGLLRLLGVGPDKISSHSLSADELRTVVAEAGVMVPRRHQRMLLSILDLDAITVDDVMVPRQEIVGLDLDRDVGREPRRSSRRASTIGCPSIARTSTTSSASLACATCCPSSRAASCTQALLLERIREPYFVPGGHAAHKQLLNFQQHRRRSAFVVDEYGDVQGLITTQDIVREIVGELDRLERRRHRRDEGERLAATSSTRARTCASSIA